MSEAVTDRAPDRSLLAQVAEAYGVATEFWTFEGEFKEISPQTIIKILGAMQIDSTTEERCHKALEAARTRPWRLTLPECSVVRVGSTAHIPVHLPDGSTVTMEVLLEEGGSLEIPQADIYTEPQEIEGELIGQATFVLPDDLPLGYHTIRVRIVPPEKIEGEISESSLIIVPEALPLPSERGADGWGVTTQLYSVRSRDSWGIGDTADLKELCSLFHCSHEIKRRLLLGRKVMANLDNILEDRDITLPTKVHLLKAMVFPVVMYGCESWTVKKAEHQRIDAFELWCWRRLLRVP